VTSSSIIVFDLDDTLFSEGSYVRSGFAAVDEWLLRNSNVSGFLSRALEHYNSGARGRIIDLALQDLSIFSEALVTTLVTHYREHSPRIDFYPDAQWALEYFHESNSIGLLTDGWLVSQRQKVKALGLERLADHIIYSDALGRACWKPSAAPYCALVEKFSCRHSDCVYIADNPQKDFITARKLGWTTIRVLRPEGEYRQSVVPPNYDAHVTVSSLYELANLFPKAI
jgi:putative hydrolase of the HAD superfamily